MAPKTTPIRPFIFVGVGGTGGKTLGIIRKTLDDALNRAGWTEGWPLGWQFVHIDVPAAPDADAGDSAFSLPRTDYVPLTTAKSTYSGFHDVVTQELSNVESDAVARHIAWHSWRPEPPRAVKVNLPIGAGQFRAVGRVAAVKSLKSVDQALRKAHERAVDGEAGPQLKRAIAMITGESIGGSDKYDDPVVFVVGSVSGGSGSGMFMDVADVLRAHGHRNVNSILFTPEVFERPGGKTDPGIAPNTFLALSEISNSMWTHDPADAPQSRDLLFSRAGVAYPVGRDGSSTFLLIGRKNSSVAFDSADDVFKIVGRSIGELTMDPSLTAAMVAYDLANAEAVALGGADTLGLSRPDLQRDVAPFRSLGFARLSVGRDFFDRYATDRILRRVALRLLDGHLERRRPEDPSSDDELKWQVVNEVWPAFLRDARLDEVGRDQNAVSDALDSWEEEEVARARAEFAAKLRDDVAAAARRGNVETAKARALAVARVRAAQQGKSAVSAAITRASGRLAHELQGSIQDNVTQVIVGAVASYGLPVTLALVEKLIDRAREGVASLDADQKAVASALANRMQALAVPASGEPTQFPVGSVDDIDRIVQDASKVLRVHVALQGFGISREFLDDLAENLLVPWRQAISDADGLLRLELRPVNGLSPLELWPGDAGVPEYLRPSKVEFLLDDVDGFPEQFVQVIERSVSGPKGTAAVTTAVEQIIAGMELGVHSLAGEVGVVDQPWVPALEIARGRGQSRATAQVKLAVAVEDLKARTYSWLNDEEKHVGRFLRQSLGDYLTDPLSSAPELKRRQTRLVGHFESMVRSSLPLVALEPALTNLIHGHDQPPYNLHASVMNVPKELEEVRDQLRAAAASLLGSAQAVTFTNNPKRDARIMTLLKEPYHLVEVASVMAPIADMWQRSNPRDLWQFRRARPLSEWVPLGPDARRALLIGWFAARLLGDAQVGEDRGKVALSVRVDRATRPIPSSGVRLPSRRDHVGLLMEALLSALVQAFSSKNLDSLAPYRHLIALGASIDAEFNDLLAWVSGADDGRPGAPEMQADLEAGLSRADAARVLIGKWKETYSKVPQRLSDVAASQAHATYEIYPDILLALSRVEACIEREPEGPDVY